MRTLLTVTFLLIMATQTSQSVRTQAPVLSTIYSPVMVKKICTPGQMATDFQILDYNQDSRITYTELSKQAFGSMHANVDTSTMQRMFAKADANSNNTLESNEYYAFYLSDCGQKAGKRLARR